MRQYTLTVLDTAGIQDYIFGSNRLRENIGASELVERATRLWPFEELRRVGDTNITSGDLTGTLNDLDDARHIENPEHRLVAEVVYAGGGNTVILFQSMDRARSFAHALTRRVLEEAPGIEIILAHREFEWDGSQKLRELVPSVIETELQDKQQNRRPPLPMLGLGVTAACSSSGLPAVETHQEHSESDRRLVSGEILAKLKYFDEAEERLERVFEIRKQGHVPPRDLDNLGRVRGEESYIAIVHADGNRMGQLVNEVAQQNDAAENRGYVQGMRDFSRKIETATQVALRAIVNQTVDSHLAKPGEWLPFRPIIFGGDDIAFVCNGPLGLPLAIEYLDQFERATKAELGRTIHACAGVAVVKVHYPFSRAYALAEELCSNTKRQVRATGTDFGALDWQFVAGGIAGDLDEIRRREYQVWLTDDDGRRVAGSLCQRPVRLYPSQSAAGELDWAPWRTWSIFDTVLREFTEEDGDWYERRNKVKALRSALRNGPEAVRTFLLAYDLKRTGLPARTSLGPIAETGWDQKTNQCAYFDAIEAMDHVEWLAG